MSITRIGIDARVNPSPGLPNADTPGSRVAREGGNALGRGDTLTTGPARGAPESYRSSLAGGNAAALGALALRAPVGAASRARGGWPSQAGSVPATDPPAAPHVGGGRG